MHVHISKVIYKIFNELVRQRCLTRAFTVHKKVLKVNEIFRLPADVLIGFSLTVKAATLIFISGRGSAISSVKEGKPGFVYYLVKS